jgi:hypothetical protein
MALEQLHKVVARPVALGTSAKTKENFDFLQNATQYVNASMADGANTPKGVLGGSVASMDTDDTYKASVTADTAMGLFGIDAAGEAFESNKPKDHGKITLVSLGYHYVDKYETKNAAITGDVSYTSGDPLVCSVNGLLTSETGLTGATTIAVVETAPASLGDKMLIKLLV